MKTSRNDSTYTQKRFNEKLEKSSKLFTLLGLVLALFIVYVIIEYQTKQIVIDTLPTSEINDVEMASSFPFKKEVPIEKIKHKKKLVEVQKRVEIIEKVKVVIDETPLPDELLVEPSEEPQVELEKINVVDFEEEYKEDVPFLVVEEAPVFPGCSGTRDELRSCLEKNIKKHINRKFDVGLAQDLGLSTGKKRIFVVFKIDNTGKISDVITRAPHPKLELEAERVVRLLPKMKGGRQGNRPVGVRYAVPISFEVQ